MKRLEMTREEFRQQFGILPGYGDMFTIYDPGSMSITTEIIIVKETPKSAWEQAEIDWLEKLYSLS